MARTRPLSRHEAPLLLRWWAGLLRRLRWLVIAAWIAAAVAALLKLPSVEEAGTGAVGSLVPQGAKAIKVEKLSKTQFRFPLLSRSMIVQRNPNGLPPRVQLNDVRLAQALTRGTLPGYPLIKGAIPLSNALGAPPFAREHSTTAILFLFFAPRANAFDRDSAARQLARSRLDSPPGTTVGVTGLAPAQVARQNVILDHLLWMEIGSVILVGLLVGLRFRAVGAPLATLLAMGIAYVIASRGLAWVGEREGLSVPQEVEPVMIVLVFGVTTDYTIFFLSRFRALAAAGQPRLEAAQRSTAQLEPIVFTAGITVAAAALSLLVARLDFFRVFGPGLALAVLTALVVALTFIPAMLATFGSALFWPRRPGRGLEPQQATEEVVTAERQPSRSARFATGHPWLTMLLVLAILAACASGLRHLTLSNPIVRGLPAAAEPRKAYEAAAKGFAPGILSPTVLVVDAPGVANRVQPLARLQRMLARQPGVTLVLGPAQQPVRGLTLGATRAPSGNAARYLIVFDSDPLTSTAISNLRRIEDRMPRMLRDAELNHVDYGFAGDTALSAETIDKTVGDLIRVAPVALGAIFIILAIYLRALVAPLYLAAASVMAYASALGLASYFFIDLLGYSGLSYFIPFVTAILLVSLGSDYNVFLVGRIWQEADSRPLREAVPRAVTVAAKPITVAGLVLAGSFGLAALVPLSAFYEIALLVGVGLLLDAFLIRSLLVPALVMIVGERSGWPGKRLRHPEPSEAM